MQGIDSPRQGTPRRRFPQSQGFPQQGSPSRAGWIPPLSPPSPPPRSLDCLQPPPPPGPPFIFPCRLSLISSHPNPSLHPQAPAAPPSSPGVEDIQHIREEGQAPVAPLPRRGKSVETLRKNLREESERLQFWTKVINIGAVPLLVVILGVVLALVRRRKVIAK